MDVFDIGYSGIFKQAKDSKEQIITFTFKYQNPTQENYSTIKREILAIVLCISKFQSDLLNQTFITHVDYKSAKDVLQKNVKNLALK